MRRILACGLLVALASLAPGGDEGLSGNWKLTVVEDGQFANFWLVKLENKAGKWSGAAEGLKGVPSTTIQDLKISGDLLNFDLGLPKGVVFQFQGKMPRAGAKKVLGSITREGRSIPAFLEATAAKNAFEVDRELLTRTPNDPRVFATALELIGVAAENKASVKEVEEWVETVLRTAEGYGPRFQADYMLKLVEALSAEKQYGTVAGAVAARAEKALDPKTPPVVQVRSLTMLAAALKKSGLTERLGDLEARIEKLEEQAYAEYRKEGLGYEPAKLAGRKGKSDRAVLVELFTGAMCPPCVAADLAFDGLERTYPAKDVVLLQYHLHVPGPDPMTNADAEKRGEFYGRTLRGTPTIYFNGQPDKNAQGGGGREDGADKYKEYREVVDGLLEKPAKVQLEAAAARAGDKITISAAVKGVEKPGETVRLRLALVEEWVRYKARNGTQYHHRVVRALPGGPAGVAIANKDFSHKAMVDVGDVRAGLNKYLDDFIKNEGPFPDAQRPLRLRDLRVVAFVQDDDSFEVLQAVDVPVKE